MEKFFTGVGIAVIATILIAFAALLSGTILWLLWPIVIPAVLPLLVKSGQLPAELGWWVSVCLVWFFSILVKSTAKTEVNNK